LSRRGAWWMVVIAALWLASRPAAAHEFRPAVLVLTARTEGDVHVRFSPPSVTARGPTTGALRPVPPAHCEPRGPERWSCGAPGLAGTLAMAGLASDPVDVLVHVRWPDGAELHTRLDPETPSVVLPRGAAVTGVGEALAAYVALGGAHILWGLDHLLFLAALLLLGGRLGAHVRTITAFTVGHALALVTQSLHPLLVPGRWVEACIAASIAVAAAEALRPASHRAAAWPWALVFGLVHGLGFAGALAELGLPPAHRTAALVGFNLGVEAGQLAVVLGLVAMAAAWPRRPATRERVRRALAFAVGSVAVAWTLARITSFWEPLA
jgi:HupE / UreJ protein